MRALGTYCILHLCIGSGIDFVNVMKNIRANIDSVSPWSDGFYFLFDFPETAWCRTQYKSNAGSETKLRHARGPLRCKELSNGSFLYQITQEKPRPELGPNEKG